MTAHDDLHAAVASRLRAAQQRYTANRRALVAALAAAPGPVTLPELLERCAEVPQSSGYRNLAVLERAGVVHRIASGDDFARFELAEAHTGHHHHLICGTCGRVDDFTVPNDLEVALDAALADAARDAGFAAEGHRLDLVGRCARCA